jgi:excisionase family DNA binding protein
MAYFRGLHGLKLTFPRYNLIFVVFCSIMDARREVSQVYPWEGGDMAIEQVLNVPQSRLLSFDAAASYLDVTGQTIRRLIARGILAPVKIPTLRRVLIDKSDLDRLIDAGKRGGEQSQELIASVGAEALDSED